MPFLELNLGMNLHFETLNIHFSRLLTGTAITYILHPGERAGGRATAKKTNYSVKDSFEIKFPAYLMENIVMLPGCQDPC